eukprot:4601818-Amphidinium_carterae.1
MTQTKTAKTTCISTVLCCFLHWEACDNCLGADLGTRKSPNESGAGRIEGVPVKGSKRIARVQGFTM